MRAKVKKILAQGNRTGEGQHVDVSMAATMLSVNERAGAMLSEIDADEEPIALSANESHIFEMADVTQLTIASSPIYSPMFTRYCAMNLGDEAGRMRHRIDSNKLSHDPFTPPAMHLRFRHAPWRLKIRSGKRAASSGASRPSFKCLKSFTTLVRERSPAAKTTATVPRPRKTDAKLRHGCAATRITRHDAIVGLVTDVARVVGRPFALSERGPPANLATRIAPHEGLPSQPELKERPTFAIWLTLTS